MRRDLGFGVWEFESWEAETGFGFFDIQVGILFLCVVYAVPFSCFRSIYIRFYFTFLTMRWIENEDGPSADAVYVEFTITLLQKMCLMREVVSFTTSRLQRGIYTV